MKRRATLLLFLLISSRLILFAAPEEPAFYPDDPLWEDPDRLPVAKPESRDLSQIYDFLLNTFVIEPPEDPVAAQNVNTLGEVPDSSWFSNRMSRRVLSIEELVTGPNVSGPPDSTAPWTLIAAKTQGITPGFTIRDRTGRVFFVKFDPPGHPQLATSTEAIATRFFWAFGYHVPQNYLTSVRISEIEISPEATLTDEEGKERSFTQGHLEKIFSRVYRSPDGSTPVIASLLLEGRPIGPFEYVGTRSDDGNDIIPHEDRRELRGLRLFSAWLNHDDSRSVNSLDMYRGEEGEGFVLHHLIDFGSCLGSGSVKVQSRRAGNEYIIEWTPILKAALTLGIWDRPWRYVDYPDYPSIGRFEGDFFQPEKWKPEYPNPAFQRMLPEDAFWAAKIMLRFSDEMVAALVRTGKLENKEAEQYLIDTLLQRRDKIIRHYLPQVAALDQFEVGADGHLHFRDLGIEAGLFREKVYEYSWHSFDNRTRQTKSLGKRGETGTDRLEIPEHGGEFLMVRVGRRGREETVEVFLRLSPEGAEVVGLERIRSG